MKGKTRRERPTMLVSIKLVNIFEFCLSVKEHATRHMGTRSWGIRFLARCLFTTTTMRTEVFLSRGEEKKKGGGILSREPEPAVSVMFFIFIGQMFYIISLSSMLSARNEFNPGKIKCLST